MFRFDLIIPFHYDWDVYETNEFDNTQWVVLTFLMSYMCLENKYNFMKILESLKVLNFDQEWVIKSKLVNCAKLIELPECLVVSSLLDDPENLKTLVGFILR